MIQPADVVRLARDGRLDHCEIAPAWDGTGCYVIRVWTRDASAGARTLSHEDGAPLRFMDAIRAHAKAVQCGATPGSIEVRWPPHTGTVESDRRDATDAGTALRK